MKIAVCLSFLIATAFSSSLEETFVKKIPEGAKVLQFGTSEKSAWLARHYALCTIESKIEEINEHDGEYVFAPITNGWYNRDELAKFAPSDFDCILINKGVHQSGILKHLDFIPKHVPIFVQSDKEFAVRLLHAINRAPDTVEDTDSQALNSSQK